MFPKNAPGYVALCLEDISDWQMLLILVFMSELCPAGQVMSP